MSTNLEDVSISNQRKNKGGRPLNTIWDDIQKGEHVSSSKFAASCKYCGSKWAHRKIPKLEEHLSNHCQKAPAAVVRKYMSKVIEQKNKLIKK